MPGRSHTRQISSKNYLLNFWPLIALLSRFWPSIKLLSHTLASSIPYHSCLSMVYLQECLHWCLASDAHICHHSAHRDVPDGPCYSDTKQQNFLDYMSVSSLPHLGYAIDCSDSHNRACSLTAGVPRANMRGAPHVRFLTFVPHNYHHMDYFVGNNIQHFHIHYVRNPLLGDNTNAPPNRNNCRCAGLACYLHYGHPYNGSHS